MRMALFMPGKDGQSRYLQLQTRGRHQGLTIDEQLEWAGIPSPTLEVPKAFRYPLDLFFDALHVRRKRDMSGHPMRISFEEIETFTRLKRITLTPWELDTILALDDCAIDQYRTMTKE